MGKLSVCLSVKRVDCNKTEERSVQIFTPYERPFSLIFWEEEWLVERLLLPEILGQLVTSFWFNCLLYIEMLLP